MVPGPPPGPGRARAPRQLAALLTGARQATVVLSTPEADESTSRVLRHFYFPGDDRPFAVLGRQLPLTAPPS